MSTQFSSIRPIDRALSGATILSQSGPGSDGNESSSITVNTPLDCFSSYPGHSLMVGLLPSAGMQSVYSTTPADGARFGIK